MKIHVHTSYPCSTRSSLVITVNCRITKDSKKFLFFRLRMMKAVDLFSLIPRSDSRPTTDLAVENVLQTEALTELMQFLSRVSILLVLYENGLTYRHSFSTIR